MAATAAFSLASVAKALPSSNVGSSSCSFKGSRVSSGTVTTAPCVRYRPLKISMMAKRDQELEELRKLSDQELKDNVVELKGELFILRMKSVARQEIKNSEFHRMRKRIARMLTVHREREVEKGITKRESRKLDRVWKKNVVVKPPPSLVAIMEEKKKEKASA
eukprot:c13880_g1_i1 orf=356-844(-)